MQPSSCLSAARTLCIVLIYNSTIFPFVPIRRTSAAVVARSALMLSIFAGRCFVKYPIQASRPTRFRCSSAGTVSSWNAISQREEEIAALTDGTFCLGANATIHPGIAGHISKSTIRGLRPVKRSAEQWSKAHRSSRSTTRPGSTAASPASARAPLSERPIPSSLHMRQSLSSLGTPKHMRIDGAPEFDQDGCYRWQKCTQLHKLGVTSVAVGKTAKYRPGEDDRTDK